MDISPPRLTNVTGRRFVIPVMLACALLAPCGSSADTPPPTFADQITMIDEWLNDSRYDEVIALGDSLLVQLKAEYPNGSVRESDILDKMVFAAYRSGRSPESRYLAMAQRAVAIKESELGSDDDAVAASLMHLANLLNMRWEPAESLPHYGRAIEILESAPDENAAQLGILHSSRGVALKRLGRYDEAREQYELALTIQESMLGADHPDLASTLNNLGNVHLHLGDYSHARSVNERALAIREEHFGPDHEWVGESLSNLSTVLGYMGEYAKSLAAQERAVAIFREKLGNDHIRSHFAEQNLGIVYLDMGDFTGAAPIFRRVLAALRDHHGGDHVNVTYALDALAGSHMGLGEYSEALALYRDSVRLMEEAWGPGNLDTMETRTGIGNCLLELGRLDEAAAVYAECLDILERDVSHDSPLLCEVLHQSAELELSQGRPGAAEVLAIRSEDIAMRQLGESHPLRAEALILGARARAELGRHAEAFEMALQAERISLDHLRTTMRVLSESHALDYARSRTAGLDLAVSLVSQEPTGPMVAAAWNAIVQDRAAVLDAVTTRRRRLAGAGSSETDSLQTHSLIMRERLANLVLRGPGWEDDASYRRMLLEARNEIDRIDHELALTDQRPSIADGRRVGLDDVRDALPPRSALVAFIRYLEVFPDSNVPRFAALVLSDPNTEPRLVDLGPATDIEPLVTAWHDQARHGFAASDTANHRGFVRITDDPVAALSTYREAGEALRNAVWDPLGIDFDDRDHVFIVPDGILHLVNFSSLPMGDESYVVDQDLLIHMLDTERTLVTPRRQADEGLLLVGDAHYGEPSPRPVASGDGILENVVFSPLPHVTVELDALQNLWQASAPTAPLDILTGRQASEASFKAAAPGHGILHLATHGFFIPGGVGRQGIGEPLVFSGLALAEANSWRESPLDRDDGLLTAEEVAGLDLGGVSWAVLSACETGLGSLENRGEGVFGLRRAFALAGASTVIMSLWNVDDATTCDWMTALYRSRLVDGSGTTEAIRTASRSVLAQRREAGLTSHPGAWAGFVATGDWR